MPFRNILTRVNVWQPGILLPSHFHDGDLVYPIPMPEMPTAPLLEALRDQAPNTRGHQPALPVAGLRQHQDGRVLRRQLRSLVSTAAR